MVTSQETAKWSFKSSNLPIDTVTVYRPYGAQIIRKLALNLEVCYEFHITLHLMTLRWFRAVRQATTR